MTGMPRPCASFARMDIPLLQTVQAAYSSRPHTRLELVSRCAAAGTGLGCGAAVGDAGAACSRLAPSSLSPLCGNPCSAWLSLCRSPRASVMRTRCGGTCTCLSKRLAADHIAACCCAGC